MPARWEAFLERWQSAGLIEPATADRIRSFESHRAAGQGLRWPTILVISFGGLMIGAGVLLFVAAHWDRLSPNVRFATVLFLVCVFHILGAATAERFSQLATVFHAIGTASLGAGISLAAQIFNLREDWTGGILLWAIGAAIGWLILRDWVHGAYTAILFPFWLGAKWLDVTRNATSSERIVSEGLLLLAIAYLTGRLSTDTTPLRRALCWIGGVLLIPSVFDVLESGFIWEKRQTLPVGTQILGWVVALALPLLIAWLLRGSAAWKNLIATFWVLILGTMNERFTTDNLSGLHYFYMKIGPYIWCLIGSAGMIAWGLQEERKERVNLGVIGFGLTILTFYFSDVMDKLGRSESLIGFGLLLLLGGWALERTRRRLVARLEGSSR